MNVFFVTINKIDVNGFISRIGFDMFKDEDFVFIVEKGNPVFGSPYTMEPYFYIGHG